MGFLDSLFGKEPSVKTVSNLNQWQKALYPLLMGNVLGMEPSTFKSAQGIRKEAAEGRFDDLNLFPQQRVYEGDRVAPLTDTQQNILSGVGTVNPLQNFAMPAGYEQILARRGLSSGGGEPVGENGPEVITATEPTAILPAGTTAPNPNPLNRLEGNIQAGPAGVSALGTGPTIPSPVTEENQINVDANELMRRRNLPGYATGGTLQPGQKAVVGEAGAETAHPLQAQTQAATSQQLSGKPSTTIDKGTTENYITQSIANPAWKGYEDKLKPAIHSAYAGPGMWGSGRVKQEVQTAENVGADVQNRAAQTRYADEQARRGLSESAANRQGQSIQTSLNVQNNPLAQVQTAANIGATEFGTERGQALLPGEVSGQQVGIQQVRANIQQTLNNANLTANQNKRLSGLIEQDLAATGQIEANTAATMRSLGLTDAQIEQVKSNTANTDMDLLKSGLDMELQSQQIISQQLRNLGGQMELAGIEQTQNQNEMNAKFQAFLEENQAAMAVWNELMNIMGQSTMTAIGMPGTEGMIGHIAAATGQVIGGALGGGGLGGGPGASATGGGPKKPPPLVEV